MTDTATPLRTAYGIPDSVPAEADATWGADLVMDDTGAYSLQPWAQEAAARPSAGDCGRCARRALVDRAGRILWRIPSVGEALRRLPTNGEEAVVYNEDRLVIVARRGVGALYVQAWTTPGA